jgi:putative ABC transport system permease protein
MFTFPLAEGNPGTALSNPNSIVLSGELATKYFGDVSPLGKVITLEDNHQLTVTGVLEKLPSNSSLNFRYIVPMTLVEELGFGDLDTWEVAAWSTYVQIEDRASPNDVNPKLTSVLTSNASSTQSQLYLQPFLDIHLHSNVELDLEGRGDIKYVWILSILAAAVLIVACLNFTNMSTARASRRSDEVAIRKSVGASRIELVNQFYAESLLQSAIAMACALTLIELLLPSYNQLVGRELAMNYSVDSPVIWIILGLGFLAGILAGSYPALLMSSFKPSVMLRGGPGRANGSSVARKLLVAAQFTFVVALVVTTIIVARQLGYMLGKDLGYDKEQVLYVTMGNSVSGKYETLKEEFRRNPHVVNVSASFELPTQIESAAPLEWEGQEPEDDVRSFVNLVDWDYTETMGMVIAEGRAFSTMFPTDSSDAFIVNQEAVRRMGLESPIGTQLRMWRFSGKIVGVVEDFHHKSLHSQIGPMVLMISSDWRYHLYLRIKPGDITRTLASLEETWNKIIPELPFSFQFLDEAVDRLYGTEYRLRTMGLWATVLTILVACLGLFGLAAYMAESRTREIGIRRVFGASAASVVYLLSKEFVGLVIFANFVAWPIAYYASSRWLDNFAYRTDVAWETFAVAGVLALVVALTTVSYQAIRAARANPVDALKYE